MISAYAQARRAECWWRDCRLPSAPVEVGITHEDGTAADAQVYLCGLHAQIAAHLMSVDGVVLELWDDPSGLPVLLVARAPA